MMPASLCFAPRFLLSAGHNRSLVSTQVKFSG